MPPYLTPGVYVEVVPPKAQPISGASTTTAAFIGYGADLAQANMPAKPGALTFNTGTVTVTAAGVVTLSNGSNKWPTLAPGGTLVISGTSYTVDKRTDDSNVTLKPTSTAFPTIGAGVPFQLTYFDHYAQIAAKTLALVTDWPSFIQQFGDFQTASGSQDNNYLAQAVYGFFANGGTRCYVARLSSVSSTTDLQTVLGLLAANDEVAMVCAPLPPSISGTAVTADQLKAVQSALLAHCEQLQDRVAILDPLKSDATGTPSPASQNGFGALYFPWVSVADPTGPLGARIDVPPSGHVAGVYARTDTNRGVYKAPANEQLLGVLNTTYPLSDSIQAGLNPINVNCIRVFSGAATVWGARTVTLDPQFRYVNVRRFLIFLRKSILDGVRWAVFEPNSSGLWQRITRSVGDFLLTQWREGALLGDTPQEGFFVRCDKTTNTPDVQAQGMVVTEIGVAIVKPAEFVVFRIQQQTGG
jgi:phage tail sheath protein FI